MEHGLFPTLTEPAREAAKLLLEGDRERVELADWPGFYVMREGGCTGSVAWRFELEGVRFVLVE